MMANIHPPTRHRKKEPSVGIFWVINGNLVIDSMPLGEAEQYGDHLTHPGSHLEVWAMFHQKGTVPSDMEYEEAPRGRVSAAARRKIAAAQRARWARVKAGKRAA